MKRQRGRGRKPGGGGGGGGGGGNHGNRPLESNGPDVKIRGTAAQIYEKYMQYARDSQSGGDRVRYENYLQHAEHYFRIMAATMPRERMQQISDNGGQSYEAQQDAQDLRDEAAANANASGNDAMKVLDDNDDDGEGEETEVRADAPAPREPRENREQREPREPREPRETRATEDDAEGEGEGQEREGRGRRRRRRNRDGQPGGGAQGGANAGGGDVEARSALDALAQKQGALAGG